jgi:1,5-anhydro-D-fructose reductase (1,5-anhydro-D-mannitol-forming)
MDIRWGMIGCGDVAEVKSGPALQKANGSQLVAVMRRDRAKAEDYARRHNVPRAYGDAGHLIADPEVDAVYIATPPSSHCELALKVAAAGKPCLVEKPMAINHAECVRMNEAFRAARAPLWVAYYRRALPRFLKVRELVRDRAIGQLTSIHVRLTDPLATGAAASAWRVNRDIAGAGLFLDLASHCFDIVDFLAGPITSVAGFAINSGGTYAAEDVTAAAFQIGEGIVGTGIWNFNAPESGDSIVFTGSHGEIATAIRADQDVTVTRTGSQPNIYRFRNPPHVHQPLVQTIVDELAGRGRCESTGESGARSSWVMDRCLEEYYAASQLAASTASRSMSVENG